MTEHTHFDFAKLNERERYKLLIGTVIPRPIALVTTVSTDGLPNAGPFSFFNVLTHDPAIVAIGVENYSDMRFKDTARNIRETGEFTVHICDNALVEQMEVCAIKFGPEIDEMEEAGLATVPGQMVRSPRILAAPAALECRRHTTLQVGPAREIILGEVLGVYVRSDTVNPSNLHIDQHLMDAVGRMGGHTYTRTRDQFDIKTLTPQEWESRKDKSKAAAE
ncbi:flavin reductase family protein [Neorhizobium galegae]|uniref:flavin reductase family protein n=1 Tax=Neorhizobium galegae TaxID=399 RepID=UPI000621B7AE|nr:flavin reductase family protein [Neorhizobium galegae]MCQ1781490.1 flavin reductase family protein [Neorhizobium galegae]MCQ1797322.1 flavin reductase family protein [Neorhizobium galegae]CDZ30140.1 Nitrilotriacetate monooxygenase component B [Neorhizobium galegae bv. officinalis]CDZ43016.1 Nitrilotriacetate monooxygenase component B [Neorhizobium galegae bv. officinalis]